MLPIIFLVPRPGVSHYPENNESASKYNKFNNPEDNEPSPGPGVSRYPKDNESTRVYNKVHNPEVNEPKHHYSLNKESSAKKELSSTFCSNELALSSSIPMYASSNSPSVIRSKPTASLLQNSHPMLTRVKIGKSKPKFFVAHTEFEPTSVK